ncbi:permease [Sulfurimonas hongkongensis]|uniref:Permease n=1 Tax=Sulfurimonas hongkongensis TaxID=1172190 RepID=T0JRJ9_9BACT|nr:DMT family transporter [Sulfurimonas hongkongensis]EQB39487.1 permease [Sulfurimonas hongkongensis]
MKNSHFTYLLILAMFLWGAGWSALKILTESSSLEVVIFWRFFLMSLSFIPILYFIKIPLRLNKQSSKFILSSSVLNISFMVFSYLGVKSGYAGNGGVIITTMTPLVTFLMVGILFKTKFKLWQYFGLLLGFVGGAIILEIYKLELSSANIYFLLCAVVWGGVTLLSQHSNKHIHPVHYSFYISVVATIASFIYSYDAGLLSVFELDTEFWMALIYLAVLGQSVATTIFYIASARLGSEITSSYMFLVPIFALVVAWAILDEELQSHIVIGGSISLVAIYFINKKR